MPKKTAEFEATDVTWREHPLFPADGDSAPPEIAFIQINRYEASGPVLIARTFTAAELTSEAQIAEFYGGGLYELIGRRAGKQDPAMMGNISRKRRVRLPGVSAPLAPEAPAAAAAVATASDPALGGMSDNLLVAMLQMNTQAAAAQAAAQAEGQRQFAQLMVTMIQSSKGDQVQMMQTMIAMQAQSSQTMASLMGAILSSRGGGGGPEELAKYAALFKTLSGAGGGKKQDADEGGQSVGQIVGDIADIVQGVVELKNGGNGMVPPPGVPPPGLDATQAGR